MENSNLIWLDTPVLNKPYIIMAFTGWANAGEVPASVLWYLISRFEASLFAELKPDRFYNYQTNGTEIKRPVVNIENGIIQTYSIITTNFWGATIPMAEHDLIIISGPEPERRWGKYSEILLNLAEQYEAEKIITLGGTFDSIPHTVAPRISGVVSSIDLKEELINHDIDLVNYSGPSSIHSLLMMDAAKRGLPMINLWSHTPHYIQVTNFIGCYHIMLKLNALLGLNVDLEIARKDSEYLYAQVDEAIEKKPELQEYLRTLETEYQKGKPDSGEDINKTIIKEIEDIFKDKPS